MSMLTLWAIFMPSHIPRRCRRSLLGEHFFFFFFCYAGICRHGATACHPVAGTSKLTSAHVTNNKQKAKNITSSEYAEVLTKTFLPEGTRIFGTQGIGSWVLQQDNDPTHKIAGAIIHDWNTKHGSSISLLGGYPTNSPDFNPIENVWGYVQSKVDQLGCKTIEVFQEAVMK